MTISLTCNKCFWFGYPEELVALTDDIPSDDRDFRYCPRCEGNDFDEDEDDEED